MPTDNRPSSKKPTKTVSEEKPVFPCPEQYIEYNNYGESRPGHTHAGEDFSCPGGTDMIACEDGIVHEKSDPAGYGTYIDLDVGKYSLRYAHLSSVTASGSVKRGDKIGVSNNTGSSQGDHLHFEVRTDGGGYGFGGTIPPKDYLTGAVSSGGGTGTTSGSGGAGSFSEEDLFAIGRAAAISTQLQLPGLLNFAESITMKGAKSIYNDEPLLPFVEQLCKASLRQFQSLPNGAFFAFYPDQFGLYGHRAPYWNIDNLEIIDGGIQLNDESLATHVFVVGDTNYDGSVNLAEMQASKGVITIYDAFSSDFMLEQEHKPTGTITMKDGKDREQQNIESYQNADNFLRKYGIRPHYEEAPFIRNSFFEVFYAFTQFQILWSNQFRTSFQTTFMPELYPGGIVAFEDHGIQCFIDSVTHSFDYESGFTTQANLSAPASLGGDNPGISQGMIRPFVREKRPNK